tara:strand:+ start:4350 stop:5201 length:852 start_codon:yes stop_codon:yes gene_type:complete
MKKLILSLFVFIGAFVNAQDYDYQQLCIVCAEQNGFYCGDDPANWTQYAPNGCVPNGPTMFYLNDGWEDCVDASDETGEDGVAAVPTTTDDCAPIVEGCDTVYVDIPVIEYVDVIEYVYETDTLEIPFYIYETIIQFDTIVNTEYITQIVIDTIIEEVEVFVPEYIYVTDTVYAEVLDTMFIDVIEYVDVFVYDTIVEIETQYVEIFVIDSVVEYIEIINTEYVDCDSGLPCNSAIEEVLDKSNNTSLIYNLLGQPIKQPEGIYIENGKIKYGVSLMNYNRTF